MRVVKDNINNFGFLCKVCNSDNVILGSVNYAEKVFLLCNDCGNNAVIPLEINR
jgi:transcription elongation factor Elf1